MDNRIINNVVIFVAKELISFIQYVNRVPMLIGFVIMILLIIFSFRLNGEYELNRILLSPIVDANGNRNFDFSHLLELCAKLSVAFYILGTLLSLTFHFIYKKKLTLTFKSKLKITLMTAIIGYTLASIVWTISSNGSLEYLSSVIIKCFGFTVLTSIYSIIFDTVSNNAFFKRSDRCPSTSKLPKKLST